MLSTCETVPLISVLFLGSLLSEYLTKDQVGIMDKFLLLIILMNELYLGHSCPTKRKETNLPEISRKQITLEQKHYEAYLLNQYMYLKWPELNKRETKEICEYYIKKIFPIRDVTMSHHIITYVTVIYREVKDSNKKELSKANVAALECKLSKQNSRRCFFFFTRAPSQHCMYLLNSYSKCNRSKFYIAAEICDYHTHNELRKNGDFNQDVVHTAQRSRENDSIDKQKEYEEKHLGSHLHVPDFAIRWPEMIDENTRQKYCRIFLNELYPQTKLGNMKTSLDSLALQYVRIKTVEGATYDPMEVAALTCKATKYCARFVKAPDHKCAYLVKRSQTLDIFHGYCSLVKYLCTKEVAQNINALVPEQQTKEDGTNNQSDKCKKTKNETKQVPEPQQKENEMVDQPDKGADDCNREFPVNNERMELLWMSSSDIPKKPSYK